MAKRVRYTYELTPAAKIFLGAIIIVSVIIFFLIFKGIEKTCEDRACFNERLSQCKKTLFIGGESQVYQYRIVEKKDNLCMVEVTLLQGELSNRISRLLEGKSMVCELDWGLLISPESDISSCHGLLKEGLQDLIIQKLHAYIAQNIGRINLEVLPPPGYNAQEQTQETLLNNSGNESLQQNESVGQETQEQTSEEVSQEDKDANQALLEEFSF